MSAGSGDFLGDLLGSGGHRRPPSAAGSPQEKGVPWNSRTIDGVIYVRLSDVAELLRINNVLPKVRKGIQRMLQ